MIERAPQLLSCDLTQDLERKVAILRALGLRNVGAWMYKNRGRIVTTDIETEMRPPVEYLRSIKHLQLHRVLAALPAVIFGPRSREILEQRVRYLADELGVGDNRVGKLINRSPSVLTMSRTGTIEPKVRACVRRCAHRPSAPRARRLL
jgi:hypothetical protein